MTLTASIPTDNPLSTPITPVFGDNVQDLLNAGLLNVKPTGIIVVNSIDDTANSSPRVITLRDAIKKANADAGEDLIVFDRPLFSKQQTISLKLGELDITDNLDIIAPRDELTGGDLVTVSGNKASRVFEIEKGVTANLSGLIIADGSVTADNGGGIKNSGVLTLDSSIVRGSSATYSFAVDSGYGGGIFNNPGGKLTVNNSTISGNVGDIGGGIANNSSASSFNSGSTLEVNNSTISGNSATRFGGGIYNYGDNGTIKVSNSSISNNSGTFSGGGIDIDRGSLTVTNSTLSDNSAITPSRTGIGGGISIGSGTVNIDTSTISNNSSNGNAGGIYISDGLINISNSTISNNSSNGNGGGISGNGVFNNTNISGNSAGGSGGGIYGGGNISNSTISNNSAANDGGGIYGSGTISNSTISNNSAANDGGGIRNTNGGTLQLTNTTISDNSAGRNGGGIYNTNQERQVSRTGFVVDKGTVNAINSTLSGNIAGNQGGGIYNGGGTLNLLFSTFTLNQAANGGGIFIGTFIGRQTGTTRGSAVVRNTIIAGNLPIPDGINPDVSGNFTSRGYNLIGDGTGSTGFDEALGDIVGTSDWPIDPSLADLDFNGGPTQTVALLPDSPAIGAADPIILNTDPTTDQRGLARRASDGTADIGAFQFFEDNT